VQTRWRTASREELIAELEQLLAEVKRQQREIERLRRNHQRTERDRNRYRQERDALRKKIERLEDLLDQARRAAHRQAAPFSKGTRTSPPKRPGRKPGRAYGRKAHRPRPRHVDAWHDAPVSPACPRCGGAVTADRVATQYQEDLPVVRPVVRAFRVEIGHCRACGARVQGRHPWQTSDALGAAAAQLGPQAITLATTLHVGLGLPLAKIAHLFRTRFGLTVTAGGLVHALHRTARQATPTYERLCATIRGSPIVTPDETGWKVAGRLQWLWTFVTPETTVYAIQPGRGFEEAATVLGPDFAGALVRDGWPPYRRFTQAVHQTCLAHLLRRCRALQRDHAEHHFAPRVESLLSRAVAVRNRWRAGTMSDHGVAVARGQLEHRLNRLLDEPQPARVAHLFAQHLAIEFPAVFMCLCDPAIDATNWRAEHALRPAVVTRNVCGGNRSTRGATTQQILASVLRTIHQRELDASIVITDLLRASTPRPVLPPPPPLQ
jgi:transposase